MPKFEPTKLSKVKRGRNRAGYDKSTVFKILDSHFICHVPYVFEDTPISIPMAYARSGETIYLHGATGNRMLKSIASLKKMSITVTHLDGLVLARSAFHHSINYRSAVVFGTPRIVTEDSEKKHAFEMLLEQMAKGRSEEVRKTNENELKITKVLALNITEASAKIRDGGPIDDEDDYKLEIWAGVVPIKHLYEKEITDTNLAFDLAIPPSVIKLTKNDQ